MVVVVIPAYQPDAKLIELVKILTYKTIVVDDGSGEQYDSIFNSVESAGATVLRYSKNGGKGYALKTAFKYLANDNSIDWIVTADADGQHSPADIDKIIAAASKSTAALIIGCRRFTGYVPIRSRIGNNLSTWVFHMLTGCKVSDTQSGLRAFRSSELVKLCEISGERYEYEMNCLLQYKDKNILEIPIETVYEKGNKSSHYRTFSDTIKICKIMMVAELCCESHFRK
jgi:glycosyltransferase involved in cell wall biosynthesis